MKKEKSRLSRFKTQSKPREIKPVKESEAIVKFYPRKGRLIMPPATLDHFDVKRKTKQPVFYDLYFDHDKKEMAINFVPQKGEYSYTASEAKDSRFFEIGGPCKRQGMILKDLKSPIEVKIFKDPDEGFLFFSYASFASEPK